MKYVPFYQRNVYGVHGNTTYWEPQILAAEVPDSAENIFMVASVMWLQDNVPVCNGKPFATEKAAISAGRADVRAYLRERFGNW